MNYGKILPNSRQKNATCNTKISEFKLNDMTHILSSQHGLTHTCKERKCRNRRPRTFCSLVFIDIYVLSITIILLLVSRCRLVRVITGLCILYRLKCYICFYRVINRELILFFNWSSKILTCFCRMFF